MYINQTLALGTYPIIAFFVLFVIFLLVAAFSD